MAFPTSRPAWRRRRAFSASAGSSNTPQRSSASGLTSCCAGTTSSPPTTTGQVFGSARTKDLAGVLAGYEQVAAEVDRAARSLPVDHPVPVPGDVPWFPKGAPDWTLRWVLLHLVEEAARHAGHADIIRESIDGATAFPLMAAAENWPPSPHIKPWQPPARASGPTAPARPPQSSCGPRSTSPAGGGK